MRSFLLRCLYWARLHVLLRRCSRDKVIILTYHGFTDQLSHGGIENHQGKHLLIQRFQRHVEYLKRHHRIISLEDIVDAFQQGRKAPEGAVVITFDDGYKSNYNLAFPVLRKFNAPATIFLTTSFVDEKKYLWTDRIEYAISKSGSARFELNAGHGRGGGPWVVETGNPELKRASERNIRNKIKAMPQDERFEVIETLEKRLGHQLSADPRPSDIYQSLDWEDVREMRASGLISMGSHSHSHPILSRCGPEDLKAEVLTSKKLIEERIGASCRLFCYPNGQMGDFDSRTKDMLRSSGFACALTTVPGLNSQATDIFELKRIGVPHKGDMVDFVMNLYGVTQFLSDAKQFILKLFNLRRGEPPAEQCHG